jgi:hypothetical protein
MIDESNANEGIASYAFFNESVMGVLSVTEDSIEISDEESEVIGASGGAQRGWTVSTDGQIEASFEKFKYSSETNLFVKIFRDERKLLYRADRNYGSGFTADNGFINSGSDDLVDNKIIFKLPVAQEGVVDAAGEPIGVTVGDSLFISYVSVTKKIVRHAMEVRSYFFLFPGFQVERISGERVRAWSFRPYEFKVKKSQDTENPDIDDQADLNDWLDDISVLKNTDLTTEEKQDRLVLETIEGQRIVEVINDGQSNAPYIRGIYFADTRGILSLRTLDNTEAPKLLIAADRIRDQVWWNNFITTFVDYGPGFTEEGHLDTDNIPKANRLLRGFVFDISEHVNSSCYDNDKFGYQRDLATALGSVSLFDADVEGTGIGVANLDLSRRGLPARTNFDLSSAKFEPFRMSSIEGSAYFVRDCNKIFTYDAGFCTFGTLQADMFVRTPIFFEAIGRKARIYIERFTPQFALEKDGGIWTTTRATLGSGMSISNHPFNFESFLVFNKDETLNFHKLKPSLSSSQLNKVAFNNNSDLNHNSQSFDSVSQSDVETVGFDKIIGNKPGYNRGIEITREKGKIALNLEKPSDIYEVFSTFAGGTISFVQNEETGEVVVNGLQNKKLKNIKIYYKPKSGFSSQESRSIAIVFPNSRLIADNINLPFPGGTLELERSINVDVRYYFDDTIRISGNILKFADVTKIEFTAMLEEKYEENKVETGTPAVCFDASGHAYVFYEDDNAHVGSYGDQPEGGGELSDGGSTEISCLISNDMGDTWVDHKGIIYTAGNDVVRNPFVVSDHRSNVIHLFYVINNSLMHKTVIPSLLTSEDAYKAWRRPFGYSKDTPADFGLDHFTTAGKNIRKKESDVVIGNTEDENGFLFDQLNIASEIKTENKETKESNKENNEKEPLKMIRFNASGDSENFLSDFPLDDYIAYVDRKKGITVLYAENGKLFSKISGSGSDWKSKIEDGILIHKNSDIQESRSITNVGFSLDEKENILNLSYIVDDMIFIRKFNASLFFEDQEKIQEKIDPDSDSSRPVFVVGELPSELQIAIKSDATNIIFPYPPASLSSFDETMSISKVSPKGVVGSRGLTRMFYEDSNGDLRGFTYIGSYPYLDAKARVL